MASMYSGVMEGSGEDVAAWLTSPAFEARLFTCFPCTNITPSSANQVPLASPALSCPALPCPALPCPRLGQEYCHAAILLYAFVGSGITGGDDAADPCPCLK